MIKLQPISEDNIEAVLELKAATEFVAPNSYSLAQAYCSLLEHIKNGEPPRMPYAILNGDTVIGFAMMTFTIEDGEDEELVFDGDYFWISRFMIDESHQGKGYGKEAMASLIDLVKTNPMGYEAKYIYLSYEPGNIIAEKMYTSLGFKKSGQFLESEAITRLAV